MTEATDQLVFLFGDTGAACADERVLDEAFAGLVERLEATASDVHSQQYLLASVQVAQVEFADLEQRLVDAIEAAERKVNGTKRTKTPVKQSPKPKPKSPPKRGGR